VEECEHAVNQDSAVQNNVGFTMINLGKAFPSAVFIFPDAHLRFSKALEVVRHGVEELGYRRGFYV
jgi:hypothetical protein